MRRLGAHSGSHGLVSTSSFALLCFATRAFIILTFLEHWVLWGEEGTLSFALLCFASFAFIVVLLCFAMYQLVFFILCTRVFHKSLLLWLFCSFALHCIVLAVVVVLHCIVLAGGNPRYSIDCPLFPPVTDLSSRVQFGSVDSLISVYANVSTLPSSPHTSDNTLLHLQAHTYPSAMPSGMEINRVQCTVGRE